MKTPRDPRGLPPQLTPGMRRPPPQSRMPPPPTQTQVKPPAILPPISLLNDPPWVLLAKAAGVYEEQFAAGGVSDMAPASFQKQPIYEQGLWGLCPVVGSASMLVEGRTAFHKVAGGVFLALDLTLVGPVLRDVVIGTKAVATAGLKLVMNGGGTVLQQQAMAQFIKAGGQLVTKEAAEALVRTQMRDGHVLIVGAETSANAVNHVVAYLVDKSTGAVWRLHGGITKLAYAPKMYTGAEALTKTVGQLNTMSMYHLAHAPAEVAAWWGKFTGNGNAVVKFFGGGMPKGCAGSNVLLLEHLAQQGMIQGLPAINGAARWMPLYLDRALGGYVLNPVNVLKGTIAHGTMAAVAPLAFRTGVTGLTLGFLPQDGYNFEWSNMLPSDTFGMVSNFYSEAPTSIPTIIGIPNSNLSLDIRQATASFPAGGISVKLPPPYIKIDAPEPPSPAPNTLTGTWTTTEGGKPYRLVADNYGEPPGVWKIKVFSGNDPSPLSSYQVKMRGSEGRYIKYPIGSKELPAFHMINPNTLHQLDSVNGQEIVKRRWGR